MTPEQLVRVGASVGTVAITLTAIGVVSSLTLADDPGLTVARGVGCAAVALVPVAVATRSDGRALVGVVVVAALTGGAVWLAATGRLDRLAMAATARDEG